MAVDRRKWVMAAVGLVMGGIALASVAAIFSALIWIAPSFGLLVHDEQSRLNSNAVTLRLLNDGAEKILAADGQAISEQVCGSRWNGVCYLIGVARHQPPCRLIGMRQQDCIAIRVRAQLMQRPQVRNLIEQETATICGYIAPYSPAGTPLIHVLGCHHPGGEFTLLSRESPTLCIVVLDGAEPPNTVERYAVRGGRRVNSNWCNGVSAN